MNDTGIDVHPYADAYKAAVEYRKQRRMEREGIEEEPEEIPKHAKKRPEASITQWLVV
jgi:hypothetical protein